MRFGPLSEDCGLDQQSVPGVPAVEMAKGAGRVGGFGRRWPGSSETAEIGRWDRGHIAGQVVFDGPDGLGVPADTWGR